jgi:hypothetical protein
MYDAVSLSAERSVPSQGVAPLPATGGGGGGKSSATVTIIVGSVLGALLLVAVAVVALLLVLRLRSARAGERSRISHDGKRSSSSSGLPDVEGFSRRSHIHLGVRFPCTRKNSLSAMSCVDSLFLDRIIGHQYLQYPSLLLSRRQEFTMPRTR